MNKVYGFYKQLKEYDNNVEQHERVLQINIKPNSSILCSEQCYYTDTVDFKGFLIVKQEGNDRMEELIKRLTIEDIDVIEVNQDQ